MEVMEEVEASAPPHAVKEGTLYVVVHKCRMRTGVELDSPECGYMNVGDLATVYESVNLVGGKVRVRTDKGWISIRAGSGALLVSKCTCGHEKSAEPDPVTAQPEFMSADLVPVQGFMGGKGTRL